MERTGNNFTEGPILAPLIRFSLPVLAALFLQAMYGAVDLLIVGQFGTAADVSAVSTGSQIMMTLTNLVASFAMGATILLGQQIGEGNAKRGGETIGACAVLFFAIGAAMTFLIAPGARALAAIMHAPEEAFDLTRGKILVNIDKFGRDPKGIAEFVKKHGMEKEVILKER